MHNSIGRAAAVGVVVSLPATPVAAFAPSPAQATDIGSISLSMWACIAPAQAVAAWFGARLAHFDLPEIEGEVAGPRPAVTRWRYASPPPGFGTKGRSFHRAADPNRRPRYHDSRSNPLPVMR